MEIEKLRLLGREQKVIVLFHTRANGYPYSWKPVEKIGSVRFVNQKSVGIDLDQDFGTGKFHVVKPEKIIRLA